MFENDPQVTSLFEQMKELDMQLTARFRELGAMDVQDYELVRSDGSKARLSEFFGGQENLALIHNMGKSCPYCTLWADGFSGIMRHFESGFYGPACAFLLVNHDEPEQQRVFAAERGWPFPMACADGTSLAKDLGFMGEWDGKLMLMPGVSMLEKSADGGIRRTGMSFFGPGDSFCSLFHFFKLLPEAKQAHGEG